MEKYSIQKSIIEDIERNIARGRPRAKYVKQIMQDTNKGNYNDLK